MCLYLGTSTRVSLSWHISTCGFILASKHVNSSWHIHTCAFIWAHRHVCIYLGTSTRVPLAWHIDTCVFILVRVSKFLHRTNRVLAFATTHEQPFTLPQYGIGGLPRVRRCLRNEYSCAHLRPASAGQTGATITMDVRTPHRFLSIILHSHDVNKIHFSRQLVKHISPEPNHATKFSWDEVFSLVSFQSSNYPLQRA
jgi:hypothetical protein